jgi:phage gp46-like protein
MPDLAFSFDPVNYRGDLSLVAGDLKSGDDLQTWVILSLFTQRGEWWGDAFADIPLGSYLHRLLRAKRTTDTLLQAEDYAREALAWLVLDNLAQKVEAAASWQNRWLALLITITRADSSVVQFQWAWDALGAD